MRILLPGGKPLVSASGLAGWGNSNAIRLRRVGKSLVLIGDGDVVEALLHRERPLGRH